MACTADIVPRIETQPSVLEFDPVAVDPWTITMETPGWPSEEPIGAAAVRAALRRQATPGDGFGFLDDGTLRLRDVHSLETHGSGGACCVNCEKGLSCEPSSSSGRLHRVEATRTSSTPHFSDAMESSTANASTAADIAWVLRVWRAHRRNTLQFLTDAEFAELIAIWQSLSSASVLRRGEADLAELRRLAEVAGNNLRQALREVSGAESCLNGNRTPSHDQRQLSIARSVARTVQISNNGGPGPSSGQGRGWMAEVWNAAAKYWIDAENKGEHRGNRDGREQPVPDLPFADWTCSGQAVSFGALFAGANTDGPGDALRHCIWQCCLIMLGEYGEAQARGDNRESGTGSSARMDLSNNGVGRAIGKALKKMGRNRIECNDMCLWAYAVGALGVVEHWDEPTEKDNVNGRLIPGPQPAPRAGGGTGGSRD